MFGMRQYCLSKRNLAGAVLGVSLQGEQHTMVVQGLHEI